ncbi:diguanylate cyclase (GGDEF)-like protein [Evansella vedderi]|uniref:Diguanylate cyclase (GGDEF)-like protein n=1 Tax=Evansella vedderi TaxID=38282 RepID=A0ABT9ZQP6_9BACI|nr:GGDEF domain-containing protein [Evansella vedderi]MDQ0253047.1 diguanylate cyclase (GGDEF)-like protein [Evansella vedderi]
MSERMNYRYWSVKILNFYWLLVAVSIIGQCVGLLITTYYFPEDVMEFVVGKIIIPTSIQLVILSVCVYLIRVRKIYSSSLIIIAGTLLTLVIIVAHPNVPGLQVTLLLPMAVALIYFNRVKLLLSLVVNILGLTTIYLVFPSIRLAVTEYEYFSYIFALIAGYIIYLAIIQRGNEVLQMLRQTAKKEKELMVKTALMEKLSKVDALTGLYNHKTFQEYMDHLVKQSKTYAMPLQLAVLDIDNFKQINDSYGHSVGDQVLTRVADAIIENVSQDDIAARYGGEEFAILLTNKNMKVAFNTIEEIRIHIENVKHREIQGEKVTVSIGLKNYDPSLSKLEFFQATDALLYEAKRTGKNRIAV